MLSLNLTVIVYVCVYGLSIWSTLEQLMFVFSVSSDMSDRETKNSIMALFSIRLVSLFTTYKRHGLILI